jgi:hypothetical protein
MAQTADGTVWFVLDDDPDCNCVTTTDGANGANGGFERAFSVRPLISDLSQKCAPPTFGPAECFYRTIVPASPLTPGRVFVQQPEDNAWDVTLSAARDSNRVALAVRVFRDTTTGLPCAAPSASSPTTTGSAGCRSDVAYIERNPRGQWCNPSGACLDPLGPPALFECNGLARGIHQYDSVMSIASSDPLGPAGGPGTSHQLGAIVALDYGQLGLTWYDFRPSLAGVGGYQVYTRYARFADAPTSTPLAVEQGPWSLFGLENTAQLSARQVLGDIDVGAAARLHAHWARHFLPTTGAVTVTWSPRSPAE